MFLKTILTIDQSMKTAHFDTVICLLHCYGTFHKYCGQISTALFRTPKGVRRSRPSISMSAQPDWRQVLTKHNHSKNNPSRLKPVVSSLWQSRIIWSEPVTPKTINKTFLYFTFSLKGILKCSHRGLTAERRVNRNVESCRDLRGFQTCTFAVV